MGLAVRYYLIAYNLVQFAGWLAALVQCSCWLLHHGQLSGLYEQAHMGRTVSMLPAYPVPATSKLTSLNRF